ncbi:MAG: hypothetical protein M3245_02305 [Actinomycetota bacterium]|nr:hypothetical protein [Actinomycetota bacterium]
MRSARFIATAMAASLMLIMGSASAQAATQIQSLTVSKAGYYVDVRGTASFVDVPTVVADEPGDANLIDVHKATIARPNPASSTVQMSWDIALSTLSDLPPTTTFLWPLMVDGEDKGYFLMASRTGIGNANPMFAVAKQGSGGYTSVAITGTMTTSKVTWNVPLTRIEASPGSKVEQGAALPSGWACLAGAAGSPGFYSCTISYDTVSFEPGTIPAATVRVGMAPAGTPVNQVALTMDASVAPATGSFDAQLPAVGMTGQHIVVARACYGVTNCATASRNITL